MNYWIMYEFEKKLRQIMRSVVPNGKPGHHFGTPFLSAYQLAIKFNELYPNDVATLGYSVGGMGAGGTKSLAQYIARELSGRIKSGEIIDMEGCFLSADNINQIGFTQGVVASTINSGTDLSMFRIAPVNIRKFEGKDIEHMMNIWNGVVDEGNAFPQEKGLLSKEEAYDFFNSQSFTAVAEVHNEIVGLYILHPNNIGRCEHLANSSYAVSSKYRGKNIGEQLVEHSLEKAKELGFGILQFNAVVKSNNAAIKLYQKLGFVKLGIVPKGFLNKNNVYEDIVLFYHEL